MEAANCYDKLDEAQQRNSFLEAKLVEISGNNNIVHDVLSAENHKRRLESISLSSSVEITTTDENSVLLEGPNGTKGDDDWRNALPLRFKRELELEDALSQIEQVRTQVKFILRSCVCRTY